MKIHQLYEAQYGTFVGIRLTTDSNARLAGWMEQNLIVSPEPIDKLHVTLILDKNKKLPHHPITYNPAIPIDPETYQLDLFGTEKDVLVLKFKSEFLEKRHMQLQKKFQVDWDFPEYSPHITLTTEVQEIRTDMEPPDFELELDREYVEEMNPDASD